MTQSRTNRSRHTDSGAGSLVTRTAALVVEWVVLALVWLAYVSKWSRSDAYLGLVVASLALAGSMLVSSQHIGHLRPYLSWVLKAWRIPGDVAKGIAVVYRAAWRELREGECPGRLRIESFAWGGDDPESAGRRALAIAFTSITPRTIVVDLVKGRDEVLYHDAIDDGAPLGTLDELGRRPPT